MTPSPRGFALAVSRVQLEAERLGYVLQRSEVERLTAAAINGYFSGLISEAKPLGGRR